MADKRAPKQGAKAKPGPKPTSKAKPGPKPTSKAKPGPKREPKLQPPPNAPEPEGPAGPPDQRERLRQLNELLRGEREQAGKRRERERRRLR